MEVLRPLTTVGDLAGFLMRKNFQLHKKNQLFLWAKQRLLEEIWQLFSTGWASHLCSDEAALKCPLEWLTMGRTPWTIVVVVKLRAWKYLHPIPSGLLQQGKQTLGPPDNDWLWIEYNNKLCEPPFKFSMTVASQAGSSFVNCLATGRLATKYIVNICVS